MISNFSFDQKKLNRPSKNSLVVKRAGSDRLQNDIADLITSRNATVTKEEAISLLENYASTIEMLLKTNNSMHTPLYNSLLRMSKSYDDHSQPDLRKKIATNSQEQVDKGTVQVDLVPDTIQTKKPILSRCHNVVSNSRVVMSGSVVQLYGSCLQFDKTDSKQGVFMIDSTGNATKATTLVRMKADNIIFMVPGGLTAGEYLLEIRNVCPVSGNVESGSLPGKLTVVI